MDGVILDRESGFSRIRKSQPQQPRFFPIFDALASRTNQMMMAVDSRVETAGGAGVMYAPGEARCDESFENAIHRRTGNPRVALGNDLEHGVRSRVIAAASELFPHGATLCRCRQAMQAQQGADLRRGEFFFG